MYAKELANILSTTGMHVLVEIASDKDKTVPVESVEFRPIRTGGVKVIIHPVGPTR